jgi:hypothetical protein
MIKNIKIKNIIDIIGISKSIEPNKFNHKKIYENSF